MLMTPLFKSAKFLFTILNNILRENNMYFFVFNSAKIGRKTKDKQTKTGGHEYRRHLTVFHFSGDAQPFH